MKICNVCRLATPLNLFSKRSASKDGFSHRCKKCELLYKSEWRIKNREKYLNSCRNYRAKNKVKHNIYARNWARNNSTSRRAYYLKRSYGISSNEYEVIFKNQNGKCAICERVESSKSVLGNLKRFHVDHCHKSGKIRSLLCSNCNRALGYIKENPKIAEKMKFYILTNS